MNIINDIPIDNYQAVEYMVALKEYNARINLSILAVVLNVLVIVLIAKIG